MSSHKSTNLTNAHDPLWMRIFQWIWDVILTLLPVLFLALSCAATIVDGQEALEPGRKIEFLEQFGPTVFPIVFGAVTGRFMQFFAVWKASRGTTLGVLEQLVGSRTLFTAIERSSLIRTRSFYTLAVPILWALSPLGGQSSLRILTRTEVDIQSPVTVAYWNDTYRIVPRSIEPNQTFVISINSPATTQNDVYMASLLQSNETRKSPLDSWGNIKIPRLYSLRDYSPTAPADQWTEVSPQHDITWSSLVGIMLDVPDKNNGISKRFSIEASYLDLDCTNKFTTASYSQLENHLGPLHVGHNTTLNGSQTPLFYLGERDYRARGHNHFVLGIPFQNSTFPGLHTLMGKDISLKYATKSYTRNRTVDKYFSYDCALTMPRVEAEIVCDGLLPCHVGRMRASQISNVSSKVTPFNDEISLATKGEMTLSNFLGYFLWASGAVIEQQRTTAEWYVLTGQPKLVGYSDGMSRDALGTEYATLTDEQLSSRLAILLTTLWKISVARNQIYNQKAAESTCRKNWVYPCNLDSYMAAESKGVALRKVQRWKANKAWIAITMIVSIIALGFGGLGIFLKKALKTPDILGYVSTMVRDNPYFHGAKDEECLDGVERARLLRSEDVRLTIVSQSTDAEGHLVLASDEKTGEYLIARESGNVQGMGSNGTASEGHATTMQDRPSGEAFGDVESTENTSVSDSDGEIGDQEARVHQLISHDLQPGAESRA